MTLIRDDVYDKLQREVLVRHFDSNETLFLERELTQLRATIMREQFPALVARLLAPKATDIAPSAETYSYKVLVPVGEAKLISYKSDDIPRVDTVAREVMGKVRPIADSYSWDINELREAARLNIPLSEVKGLTAREAIERAIDHVLAFGTLDGNDVGLNGLVNNPLVEGTAFANVMSGGNWSSGTPDTQVIYEDLSSLARSVSEQSLMVFRADTIVLPDTHYNIAAQTPYSELQGDSILTVFRRNHPEITAVIPWHKLRQAGASGKPRAIAYERSKRVLEAVIPQEFEQLPPQEKNLEFIINCHARCGGTKVYQPVAMKYMDFSTSS
jgi:hypothetical protein